MSNTIQLKGVEYQLAEVEYDTFRSILGDKTTKMVALSLDGLYFAGIALTPSHKSQQQAYHQQQAFYGGYQKRGRGRGRGGYNHRGGYNNQHQRQYHHRYEHQDKQHHSYDQGDKQHHHRYEQEEDKHHHRYEQEERSHSRSPSPEDKPETPKCDYSSGEEEIDTRKRSRYETNDDDEVYQE